MGLVRLLVLVGWCSRLRVNQLSAISSRARGPRRIRPELWVEPPPISFCQILFDRIGWAGGAGAAAVAAAAELAVRLRQHRDRNSTDIQSRFRRGRKPLRNGLCLVRGYTARSVPLSR